MPYAGTAMGFTSSSSALPSRRSSVKTIVQRICRERISKFAIVVVAFVLLAVALWLQPSAARGNELAARWHSVREHLEPTTLGQGRSSQIRVLAIGDSLTEGLLSTSCQHAKECFHPYTVRLGQLLPAYTLYLQHKPDTVAAFSHTYVSNGNGNDPPPSSYQLTEDAASSHVMLVNDGLRQERLHSMLERLNFVLDGAVTYDFFLVLGGMNDLEPKSGASSSPVDIAHTLKAIHETAHAAGAITAVITLPHVHFPGHSAHVRWAMRHKINALNDELRRFSREYAHTAFLVDLANALPHNSSSTSQRLNLWSDDGMHLTAAGYDRMGEIVWRSWEDSPHAID